MICGAEFWPKNIGKIVLIRRSVYGEKVAKIFFRNNLRSCLSHLNFKIFLDDPDVQLRAGINSYIFVYYEWVLLHADDALVVSKSA